VEWYVDSNQDPDFVVDEFLYDAIDDEDSENETEENTTEVETEDEVKEEEKKKRIKAEKPRPAAPKSEKPPVPKKVLYTPPHNRVKTKGVAKEQQMKKFGPEIGSKTVFREMLSINSIITLYVCFTNYFSKSRARIELQT